MGPISFSCLALILIALSLAVFTRDWRLKTVSVAFLFIWFGAQFDTEQITLEWLDPVYTFGIVVLVFCIQSRGRIERQRGIPLAMWLLVPLGCELLIAGTYPLTPYIGYLAVYRIVAFLFYVELFCLIFVGMRRLGYLPRRFA